MEALATSRATHPRMRSSIACVHCRRSKIKCLNAGANTTCKACELNGRECVYPPPNIPGSTGHASKRDGEHPERVEGKRQRIRRSEGHTDSTNSNEARGPKPPRRVVAEVLKHPSIFTPKLWKELLEIFQLHFSTDLPFLHTATISAQLESPILSPATASSPSETEDSEKIAGLDYIKLGLLTLTARFHPHLVLQYSVMQMGSPSNPQEIPEWYATTLRSLLINENGYYSGQPTLEKIQALLMLGLHEWGMRQGMKAWIHVGLAIRMAQAIGLPFDDDPTEHFWKPSSIMRIETLPTAIEPCVGEESRRRTLWACFILDRYLSNGRYRPTILVAADLRVQLPCSDESFLFGERVCTNLIDGSCSGLAERIRKRAEMTVNTTDRDRNSGRLLELSEASGAYSAGQQYGTTVNEIPCQEGINESLPSRFVRMVEVWGRVTQWSCAGGRRTEKHPPWDHRSNFFQLRQSLNNVTESLPSKYRLTKTNIQAHLTQRPSSPFTLLHIIHLLATIILHRENLPFTPLTCNKPEGPSDDPFQPSAVPVAFWEDSAAQMFDAARNIIDLAQACIFRGQLVETPIMGFALYIVAFLSIYALHFPYMDLNGYVTGINDPAAWEALELTGRRQSMILLSINWFRTLRRLHRYYEKVKRRDQREEPPGNNASVVTNVVEKVLAEFGDVDKEDSGPMFGGRSDLRPQPLLHTTHVITGQPLMQTRPREDWTAINNIINNDHQTSNHRPGQSSDRTVHNLPQSSSQFYPRPEAFSPGVTSLISPQSVTTTTTPSIGSASPYRHPGYPTDSHYQHERGQSPTQQQNFYSLASRQSEIHQKMADRPRQPTVSDSRSQPAPHATANWATDARSASILDRCIGGDDVAAFIDGRSCDNWTQDQSDGLGEGWLSEIWKMGQQPS